MSTGFNKYDLVGESLITLQISSSFTGSKALKARVAKVGSVTQPEVGNASRISLILSQENKANLSVRLLSEL